MICNTTGVNAPSYLSGKEKLSKAIITKANGNSKKLAIIYKGLGGDSFLSFVKERIEAGKIKLTIDSITTDGKIDFDKLNSLNGNTLGALISGYINSQSSDISSYAADSNGEIRRGFSTSIVLREAKQAVSNTIIDRWYANQTLPKDKRKTPREIIQDTIKEFKDNVHRIFDEVKVANMSEADIEKINAEIEANNERLNKHKELRARGIEIKELLKTITAEDQVRALKEEYQSVVLEAKEIADTIFANGDLILSLKLEAINNYGINRDKDIANIYKLLVQDNSFLQSVFYTPRIANIASAFNSVLDTYEKAVENEYDDTDDSFEVEMDRSTARWNEANDASFADVVPTDLKMLFDSLYHLDKPGILGNGMYQYTYTPNIGAKVPIGYRYVTASLISKGDFTSTEKLIESVEKMSNSHPSLYGLSKLAEIMRSNPVIANSIYMNLSKPTVKKVIIDVTNDGDFNIANSNNRSDLTSSLFYDIINNIRNNVQDAYNYEHKLYLDGLGNKALSKEDIDKISSIVRSYVPDIDAAIIDAFANASTENAKNLLRFARSITEAGSEFIDTYSKFIEARSNNKKLKFREFVDKDPYGDFVVPIKSFVEQIKHYTNTRVDLNSANAEGNLSSDTVNNAYIIQFTSLVKSAISGNQDSINTLIGMFANNPQFKHSPILFGVKSGDNIISNGIFIRKGDGSISINPDAQNILDVYLFDGTRDQSEDKSAIYKSMSKADYFITQLIQFYKEVKVDGVSVPNTALYMVKTPSDAPKQFAIRGVKYSTQGMYYTDIQRVIDKINQQVAEQISSVKLTNEDKGLINSLFGGTSLYYDPFSNTQNGSTFYTLYNLITDSVEVSKERIQILNTRSNNRYVASGRSKFAKMKVNIGGQDVDFVVKLSHFGNRVKGEIVSYGNSGSSINPVEGATKDTILKELTDNGVFQGSIAVDDNVYNTIANDITPAVNPDTFSLYNSPAFRAIHGHILSELENMLFEMNRVGTNNNNYITISNGANAATYTNYNTVKGKMVDEKGNLLGQVFKFTKLFQVGDKSNGLFEALFPSTIVKKGNGTFELDINNSELFGTRNTSVNSGDTNPLEIYIKDRAKVDEIINREIAQFIERFTEFVINESELYADIIDGKFSNKQIIDFALNQYISNMNLDSLFDGDSKFYKDAQTILKRLKQIQAGGKSHAGANPGDIPGQPITTTKSNGSPVEITIGGKPIPTSQFIDGVKQDGNMLQRNGFRAITISNTERPLANVKQIYENLKQIYISQGATEDVAKQLAENTVMRGYNSPITADDAQSFITLEEFIRRKFADGTLSDYEGIEKFLDPNYELTPEDYAFISKIQVQKNFYYDVYPDPRTGILIPRQIKNSEFVLIPALLKGQKHMEDLQDLYDMMRANDIGQVNTGETSKAANTDMFQFWNKEGEKVYEPGAPLEGRFITDYYYKNLYKQQDVIDHLVDETNKASIAFMKKFLDNPDPKLREVIDRYLEAYTANIEDDFQTLISTMGWKVNEDGAIVNQDGNEQLDYSIFYEKARAEAARMGLDSKFLEFLTPVEYEVGGTKVVRPVMPNFLADNQAKLESIAQSIFNRGITRQNLPGWHGPQLSSVGINAPVLDENGQIRKLAYHPQVSIAEASGIVLAEDKTFREWYKAQADYPLIYGENDFINLNEQGDVYIEDSIREAYQQYINDNFTPETAPVYTEPYMEIMIPRWSEVIPEGATIDDLIKAGLNEQIGYRVPTEGKQSITKIKVVGFLDEMYGSTVVVPDGWVAQSGSDFDVDSIYAVVAEMYRDRRGQVKKVEPLLSEEERIAFLRGNYDVKDVEFERKRYIQYVKGKLNLKRSALITSEFSKEDYNELVERFAEEFDDQSQYVKIKTEYDAREKELYESFDVIVRNIIDAVEESLSKDIKQYTSKKKFEANKARAEQREAQLVAVLNELVNSGRIQLTEDKYNEYLGNFNKYASIQKDIFDAIVNNREDKKLFVDERLKQVFDSIKERQFVQVEEFARRGGIKSFEEFQKYNLVEQQSKKARNNIIFDTMRGILTHPSSRAENLARSNFDHVKQSMSLVAELRGESAKSRSAYNPFDQIDFMGNARSGASIKAISVTHDTHKSQCNNMKAELNREDTISVLYTIDPQKDPGRIEAIERSYGVQRISDTQILVPHRMYGWSLDNRNVVGELVTTYSSETTAHALDVIKEGNIFNVNDYTFVMFKVMANLGIDFDTSITYMALPHISHIVDAYNAGNSIYVSSSSNYLTQAVRNIIGSYVKNKYDYSVANIYDGIKLMEENIGLINDPLYNKLLDMIVSVNSNGEKSYHLNLDYNKLIISIDTALKNKDADQLQQIVAPLGYNKFDFDKHSGRLRAIVDTLSLHTMVHTARMFDTAKRLETLARLSNPDKFGARVSMYETRSKIRDIEEAFDIDNPLYMTLLVGDGNDRISYMEALYPGFADGKIDVKRAKYKYQAKFLQAATLTSVAVNENLFEYDSVVYALAEQFETFVGKRMSADIYKNFKSFVSSIILNDNDILSQQITLNDNGAIVSSSERSVKERHRIFGYSVTTTFSYNKEQADKILNGKSKENRAELIENFAKLTPSQKINWIKNNFEDSGIFQYIKTRSDNNRELSKRGISRQTLSINDSIEDSETLYGLFRDAFFNKNPLVRLAAIDIIKYHYIVDGGLKKNGVGKVITNDAILGSIEEFGTNLVEHFKQNIGIVESGDAQHNERIIQNFVRTNPSVVPISRLKTDKIEANFDKSGRQNKGVVIADIKDFDTTIEPETKYVRVSFKQRPVVFNEVTQENEFGKAQKVTILYEVYKYDKDNEQVTLIPLNKLDKEDAGFSMSMFAENNVHYDRNSYVAYLENDEVLVKHKVEEFVNVKDDELLEMTGDKFDDNTKAKILDIMEKNFANADTGYKFGFYINSPKLQRAVGTRREGAFVTVNINGEPKIVKLNGFEVTYSNRSVFGKTYNEFNEHLAKGRYKSFKEALDSFFEAERNGVFNSRGQYRQFIEDLAILRRNDDKSLPRVDFAYIATLVDEVNDKTQEIKLSAIGSNPLATLDSFDDIITIKKIAIEARKRWNSKHLSDAMMNSIEQFNKLGIDTYQESDLEANRTSIYEIGAQLYREEANMLLEEFNNFVTSDGEVYKLTDKELYEKILNSEDDANRVMYIITKMMKYGHEIENIVHSDTSDMAPDVAKNIDKIVEAIMQVRNNKGLSQARDLIYNVYYARMSTNPLVRNGLIDLTTIFNDTDFADLAFSDIAELNHKQIQAVVSNAYKTIEHARNVEAPREVKAFEEEWERIMAMDGDIDWEKIDNNGTLAISANDQFYEDRKAHFENVRKAEEEFGKNSVEHLKAKLARDKFMARNTNQPIVSSYYAKRIAIEEKLLNEVPNMYSRYLQMRDEVYADDRPMIELTEVERIDRIVKQTELNRMRRGLNTQDGTIMASAITKTNAKILNDGLTELSRLNDEHYEVIPDNDFVNEFNTKAAIIEDYHKNNPNDSFIDAIVNSPEYAEAYEWIQNNTRIKLDSQTQTKYDNYRKLLYGGDSEFDDTDRQRFIKDSAYDEFGNTDPSKLSQDNLEYFKNKNSEGERIVKPKSPIEGVVWDDDYYKALEANMSGDKPSDEEKVLISSINSKLSHSIDEDGYFSWVKLKNAIGYDGLKQLADEIDKYNELVKERNKAKGKTKKAKVTRSEFNDEAFKRITEEVSKEINNNHKGKGSKKSSKDYKLFVRIFGLSDVKDNARTRANKTLVGKTIGKGTDNLFGEEAFNPMFFSYSVPAVNTEALNNKINQANADGAIDELIEGHGSVLEYFEAEKNKLIQARINADKTEAKKWISDNTHRKPTQAYYKALREAHKLSNEDYAKWYEANHYFDRKTRKYQPLTIWTESEIVDKSDNGVRYERVPTNDNGQRTIKKSSENPEFVKGSANYNPYTGQYSDIHNLNDKELAMAKFLKRTAMKHAIAERNAARAERGFIPRLASAQSSTGDKVRGALSLVGIQWKKGGYNWEDEIGFEYDKDPAFNMMELVRTDESLDLPERPYRTIETDDEWEAIIQEYEERVKEVEAHNKRIDEAVRLKDYKEIYSEYIKQSIDYNAKRNLRHGIYLTIEDLKARKAIKGNPYTGRPVELKGRGTDSRKVYATKEQSNAQRIFENWAKRFLFDQYHIGGTPRKIADSIQNFTSAKFMVLNATGGIKNVLTGMANVYVEVAAGQFLDHTTFAKAQGRYLAIAPKLMTYSITDNEKATSLDEAFVKRFNVVDVEGFMLRGDDSKFGAGIEKARNLSYGMQTAGEHFMQNVMMLAMTESYKIYADENGDVKIGTLNEYIQQTEHQVLLNLITNNPQLKARYKIFINNLKRDAKRLYNVDKLIEDPNLTFLKELGNKQVITEYINLKKQRVANAKESFKKFSSFRDAFELRDGRAEIKQGHYLTDKHIAEFITKVKSINKKTHGVYDKLGAAFIEKFALGSLAMQYHKHIYPGLMKRFRVKGYYNEHRGTYERGSYVQLASILATSWEDAIKKGQISRQQANSVRNTAGLLTTVLDFVNFARINYTAAPEWQRANMRRVAGDLKALLVPIALKMMMNMVWDDDEIEDDVTLANIEYALKAHYQELNAQHAGLAGEASAFQERPFAFVTNITDLYKLSGYITDKLFDEEYDSIHRKGRHKGKGKIEQLIRSNIPGLRNYDKWVGMPANNSYYKKGASNFGMPDIDPDINILEDTNDGTDHSED